MKTFRWPIREFQFILAVTEANMNFALHHICDVKLEELVDFRYILGLEMIYNEYIENETRNQVAISKIKLLELINWSETPHTRSSKMGS